MAARKIHRLLLFVGLILGLTCKSFVATVAAGPQPFNIQTVALSGQPAPGTGAGITYEILSSFPPTINAAGESAFVSSLTGPGVSDPNNTGIWVGAPGKIALLARRGNPAPGTSATFGSGLGWAPTINLSRQSAFYSSLTGTGVTGTNNTGIWLGAPGAVSLLAREGDSAPGTGVGVNFSLLNNGSTINVAGQSAFWATVAGSGVTDVNNSGLWSGAPGAVALLAREGDPAPGTTAGVNFAFFESYRTPTLNAAGQSTFIAQVIGTGVTNANDLGIWSGAPGSVALLARTGDPAPDVGPGVTYSAFGGGHKINAAGRSTFMAFIAGAGITTANNAAVWVGVPGNLMKLVRLGDQAPGTAAGVHFAGFNEGFLNAAGQSAFLAWLSGPGITDANEAAIWKGEPGLLTEVVREGDPAPGLAEGTLFNAPNNIQDGLAINDRGEVAFRVDLTGPDVTAKNDGSLWVAKNDGALALIVREGGTLEVMPGDMRVVAELRPVECFAGGSGDEDGFSSGLSDAGHVIFKAFFTDGSEGIFIATPALHLVDAVSRKMHGKFGPFDIDLPRTGQPGVECRSSGGNHTLVLSFANSVISGTASVTSGTGVAASPTFAANTMTVNLSGVADVQKITIKLENVTDSFGQILPDTAVSMNVLAGDTNGSKSVSSADIGQTKGQVGAPVTNANFRQDATPNGSINTSDVGLVKSRSGATLP